MLDYDRIFLHGGIVLPSSHSHRYLPLWTGLQIVDPRFIPGAVVVQIPCIDMENIDTVEENTTIYGTI